MDTDSFIINIETEDFYEDIAQDINKWFDTSNCDKNDKRPLPIGITKRVIGKLKDELGGKIMIEFCALRAKTYSFLLNDDTEKKRVKDTKKCIIKRKIMFEHSKGCLFNDKDLIKSQLSDHHDVYMEEVNKIALSSNDDKRIPTFDKVTTYPCRTNAFKVCEAKCYH